MDCQVLIRNHYGQGWVQQSRGNLIRAHEDLLFQQCHLKSCALLPQGQKHHLLQMQGAVSAPVELRIWTLRHASTSCVHVSVYMYIHLPIYIYISIITMHIEKQLINYSSIPCVQLFGNSRDLPWFTKSPRPDCSCSWEILEGSSGSPHSGPGSQAASRKLGKLLQNLGWTKGCCGHIMIYECENKSHMAHILLRNSHKG